MSKFMELSRIHLRIRKEKLAELDEDLRSIFDGISIEEIIDKDLDEVFKIQDIRCKKQIARRR